MIDDFVAARERMKQWKPNVNPHLERFSALSAEILSWYETEPAAGEKIIAEGLVYKLPISPRENKRTVINVLKFLRKVGAQKYALLVPPTLTVIEGEIPKDKRQLYIAEERSGKRTIGEPVLREAA